MKRKTTLAKSGSTAVSLTTGDGTTAVTFLGENYDSEPDVNYQILTSFGDTLGTVTTSVIYITLKTVSGFTINVVGDSDEASINVDWNIKRPYNA